jgi:Protein of unknown function (DUF2909)
MPVKLIAVIVFLAIVFSLGLALYQLMRSKDGEQSAQVFKALRLRIGLSLLLFLSLLLALSQGWVQPSGIGARMHAVEQAKQQTTTAPPAP